MLSNSVFQPTVKQRGPRLAAAQASWAAAEHER